MVQKVVNKVVSIKQSPKLLAITFAVVFGIIGAVYLLISSAATAPTILTPSSGATTLGLVNIEVSTGSRSKSLQGFVYVNGIKMPGKLTYLTSRKYVYKELDGSTGLNMMQFDKGSVQIVAELGGAKGAPITVNNTGTTRIANPYDGLTYARKFTVRGVIDLPTLPTTAKLVVDGAELPGNIVPLPNGWVYQNPDNTYDPTLAPGTHTLQLNIDTNKYKSWPVKVVVSDTLEVKILSPTEGQTGLATTIDPGFKIDNPQTSIKLLVDGQYLNGSIQYLPTLGGWKYRNQDGTAGVNLANGVHTMQVDNAGAKSAVVNFTVGTTTTSSTTTTTSPTTTGGTWGDHMGMNIWFTKANIDRVNAMGLKWVRISWELPWDATYIINSSGAAEKLTDNVAYAHSKGIKVLQSCQKTPHSYSSSDISSFVSYCASWVDKGADAIEIGNEWNHGPFWGVYPGGNYTLQAQLSDATTTAIRAKSATIPIMNAGWSPENQDQHPYDIPQQAMQRLLSASTSFKANGTKIAHHPYAYNCNSALKCSYDTPADPCSSKVPKTCRADWNAFLATQDVYQAAKANGYDKPVWMTEIGGPSGGIDTTTGSCFKNVGTGQCFTLESQRQLFADYITGIKQMRAAGTPIELIFWSSLVDGASATNNLEKTSGAYDASWTIKPAGQIILDQVKLAW